MANESDKVKLTKSKSCGRISSASGSNGLSGSQSGSSGINPNSGMRKSTRQRQAGSHQSKSQGKKKVEDQVVPPIVEEPNQNGKDPNDEGILKSLKDLEWEVSEILAEKLPSLVELGCSILEPDELHRQLIHVNRKLLQHLKCTVQDLESRANELLAQKLELKGQNVELLADKLELESRNRDLLSEKLELKTQANEVFSEKLGTEARNRELIAEKLDLESRISDLISDKLELEDKFENLVDENARLRESQFVCQEANERLQAVQGEIKVEKPSRMTEKPIFDPTAFGFGTISTLDADNDEDLDDFGEPVRWSSNEDLPALAPARPFSAESDQSLGTRLSEVAYREEVRQMTRQKNLEESKMEEKSVIRELRQEIGQLKKFKETAIIETVDKDRLIAEMEQQLVDVQREYDESKEECLAHQKVIQDLKASVEQKSHLNSGLEQQLQSVGGWTSASRPSTYTGHVHDERSSTTSQDFKSCFARTLDVNGPDRLSWLEQELLRARQKCIQIEADLEQLHQSHWALLDEYGRLQDDFRILLLSVKTGNTNQIQMISDRLQRDVSVLQETVSSLRDELRNKESIIDDLHRQCQSYEAKFDVIQNVDYVRDMQRELKERENQIRIQEDALHNMQRALDGAGISVTHEHV